MNTTILTASDPRRIRGLKKTALRTASATAILLTSSIGAHAQQPAAAPEVETEIVVTGTRIVRDGYEAPTPLTVVGVDQIQSSGTSNIADYVTTIPAFAGSRVPAATNSSMSGGSAGVNSINLRNLGLTRTLVLLDGQRSVGSTNDGGVDVNTFPQNLISRIDVVTGGASAAYGSDALAGVVNFILDKEFTGIKGEASGGVTTYGDRREYDVSIAAGTGFASGRGHVLLSAQTAHSDGIFTNDRPWNLEGWEVMVNPAYGTGPGKSTSVPERILLNHVSTAAGINGGIIASGPLKGTAFGPGGTPYQFVYGDIVSGSTMSGGGWQAATIRGTIRANGLVPYDTRHNVYTRASYDLADNVNVFASFSWAQDYNNSNCCPPEYNGSITVEGDNAFIPASVQTKMQQLGLTQLKIGSMNFDLPMAGGLNIRRVQRFVAGANGSFDAADTAWTWDAYFQMGITRTHEETRDAPRRSRFDEALDAVIDPNTNTIICRSTLTNPGNGCVPYNLFGIGVNTQAAVDYVMGRPGVDYRYSKFTQKVFAASVQGEPFSTWAGPVSVAFGAEHRTDSADGIADEIGATGDWLYGNYRPLIASNSVTEGFIETVVPLAVDTEWAESLELNAAVRATDYKNSGFVTTYKVGLTYDPVDDIRFRLTRSRDIRAPGLLELFSGGGGGFPGYLNPFKGGASEIGVSSTSGNPDLIPEKSDYTGVGVVLQPSFLPGFNASVDYWNLSIKDAIGTLTTQQIIDQCYASGDPQVCAALDFAPDKTILLIRNQPFNLVSQVNRGIDLEASYRTTMDAFVDDWEGALTLRFLATNFIKAYSSNGINTPTDLAGVNANVNGAVPNWRWNSSISYSTDVVNLSLAARGISAGTYLNSNIECTSGCPVSTADNRTVDNNRIDGAVYFDASMTYKFSAGDADVEAFFNVRNLMNKDPAIAAPGPGGYTYENAPANPTLYDVLGRTFRAGVRFKM